MRTPVKAYRVLVADPPWAFGDSLPGASRGAVKNYRCMSTDEICAFPIPVMREDSVLFLWRVSAMVEEAYRVVRAWGFVPKSEVVWQKMTKSGKHHFGMGRTVRASHETAIIATRGRPERLSGGVRSTLITYEDLVFLAATGAHSQKPEEFYTDVVERLYSGPYCELFGRRHRPGWDVFGDELPEKAG